ncbi:DUF342 domain-containing protein [Oceanidesulfovibrio indonesiensis]|nr:FapA family protein [Oceanidesulfovibrio indonesiensis]
MGRSIVYIEADNEADARQKASDRLKLPGESIEIVPSDTGPYEASVEIPGPLNVRIDTDMFEARVDAQAPEPGMRAPSRGEIMAILAAAGIKIAPKAHALETLVQELAAGRDVDNLLIAEGSLPQRARDGSVEPQGDWDYPVVPGEDIGVLIPAQDAQQGVLLDGAHIPAQGPPSGEPVEFSGNPCCRIDKNSYTVRSETYGMVQLDNNILSVKPAFHVRDNALVLEADIFARDNEGRPFTTHRYRDIFSMLGFVEGFSERAVEKAIEKAQTTGEPQRMSLVCQGRKPVHGIDGWFEMMYQDERSAVGSTTKNGAIDFRERGVVRAVKQNEILGVLHPPVPGTPGKDIFGRIIPASDGRPFGLVCEEHADVLDDGKTFFATAEGMVFLKGNRLTVTDVFRTEGDVDLSTGNLKLEKGSLYVAGSILSGFSVSSPANIFVEEIIESAQVHAAGSVEVKGGIIMERGGEIHSEQDVSALFMKNAVVKAGGSVQVKHEISTSEVIAGHKVFALTGRGKVFGSTIRCGEGMEVQELGNEAGVETTIHLGKKLEVSPGLIARKKELTTLLAKIYGKLGSDPPQAILERTRPEFRESMKRILGTRLEAEKELETVTNAMREERARQRKETNARIRIYKFLYPGVVVHGYGSRFSVTEAASRCCIFYDQTERRLTLGSL